jgi:hypothetical protein
VGRTPGAKKKITDFFICWALPVSGIKITALIALVQSKGNERIVPDTASYIRG